MEVVAFTINGRIPSLKNNKVWTGRYLVSSKAHREWHKATQPQIEKYKGLMLKNIEMQFDFYLPDKRKTDLDNKISSLLDFFVDMKIIAGDHWQNIRSTYYQPCGIDRKNPRVEIWMRTS